MGSFTELKDTQWKILEPLMPPPPPVWKCGRKCTHWRKVLNTIFWVLTTGARWRDVPKGPQWSSRSSAHRYLGEWQEDGTWQRVLSYLEELADMCGMIDVERLKIDGFFFRGKGRWSRSRLRIQGKRNDQSPSGGQRRKSVSNDHNSCEWR
jgi:transposase